MAFFFLFSFFKLKNKNTFILTSKRKHMLQHMVFEDSNSTVLYGKTLHFIDGTTTLIILSKSGI